jgi:hypothetical protein
VLFGGGFLRGNSATGVLRFGVSERPSALFLLASLPTVMLDEIEDALPFGTRFRLAFALLLRVFELVGALGVGRGR